MNTDFLKRSLIVLFVLPFIAACSKVGEETMPSEKVQSTAERVDPTLALHDIWVLKAINGAEIRADSQMKGLPVFEFHVGEGRFLSSGGCNSIQGPASFEEGTIHFGMLVATRMMCPDMSVEDMILRNLSEKDVGYRLEKGTLVLLGEDRLELKKID